MLYCFQFGGLVLWLFFACLLLNVFLPFTVILLSKVLCRPKSSHGHHRCVTHFYRLPMWCFYYVMLIGLCLQHGLQYLYTVCYLG